MHVDPVLHAFVAEELLAGLDLTPDRFWQILAGLQRRFAARTAQLLARRDELQECIDGWHRAHGVGDVDALEAFLTEIGYLVPVEQPTVRLDRVDPEIAEVAGPQLVVPATVPRYALNAANARWGSLYDALYGTDALPVDHELAPGYDARRGAAVIAEVDRLLDELFPLAAGSHAEVTAYRVASPAQLEVHTPAGATTLADPAQFVGHRACSPGPDAPGTEAGGSDVAGSAAAGAVPRAVVAVLLRRNGLHVELTIDPAHRVGRHHHAGVADVMVESAVTTIVDLEDSVATVDGPDKVGGYRTWLGLMTATLQARFAKGGERLTRRLHPDRRYTGTDGAERALSGRSLLLVRTVGHHMRTDAVTVDGEPVVEGLLDTLVTATAALHDRRGPGRFGNSRAGNIYLVKPKMHGPDEVALAVQVHEAVEAALGLAPTTLKIGIMDEERRTSVNLEACIARAADRVIFINTGFLDRTGDEIHTGFEAGPMVGKGEMRSAAWLAAYEDRNVEVGLRASFVGQAQIGKGMFAKPAAMRELLDTKGAHPQAGANCAWVPSPTAATLHALHYLRTDVAARQRELAHRPPTDRRRLLAVPVLAGRPTDAQRTRELETNAQAVLGYVVRWVTLGIGCSTVPDLDGVGLMEDRATLRISSQHIANWLRHGVVGEQEVRASFARMAALVDEQNASEPGYRPMSADLDASEAFQAALELVFTGRAEPNGYTERALTRWRRRAKRSAGSAAADRAVPVGGPGAVPGG